MTSNPAPAGRAPPEPAPPPHDAPATPAQPASFEIYLAWSDLTLIVNPDQTALHVLQTAGVAIDAGCHLGSCGNCATPFVLGDVIHRDACLTNDDRKRYFCPCVSRARGRLVLAL